jgi:hypothetical protein
LVAPLDFSKLLAHFGDSYRLIAADFGYYVTGLDIRIRPLRYQVQQHTDPEHPYHGAEKNSNSKFSIVKDSSHP